MKTKWRSAVMKHAELTGMQCTTGIRDDGQVEKKGGSSYCGGGAKRKKAREKARGRLRIGGSGLRVECSSTATPFHRPKYAAVIKRTTCSSE